MPPPRPPGPNALPGEDAESYARRFAAALEEPPSPNDSLAVSEEEAAEWAQYQAQLDEEARVRDERAAEMHRAYMEYLDLDDRFHRFGMLEVTVHEATGLGRKRAIDPYVRATLEGETLESKHRLDVTDDVSFQWRAAFDLQRREVSLDDSKVRLELRDQGIFFSSRVAVAEISLAEVTRDADERAGWFSLTRPDGKGGREPVGSLLVTTRYHPPLQLRVHRARGLYNAQWVGKQSVVCSMRLGRGGKSFESEVAHRCGTEPAWDNEVMHINPHLAYTRLLGELPPDAGVSRSNSLAAVDVAANEAPPAPEGELPRRALLPPLVLELRMHNRNLLVDDFLGRAAVPLQTLVENAGRPMWFRVGRDAGWRRPAGEVLVSLHHHTFPSYDSETVRKAHELGADAAAASDTRLEHGSRATERGEEGEAATDAKKSFERPPGWKPPLPPGPPPARRHVEGAGNVSPHASAEDVRAPAAAPAPATATEEAFVELEAMENKARAEDCLFDAAVEKSHPFHGLSHAEIERRLAGGTPREGFAADESMASFRTVDMQQ